METGVKVADVMGRGVITVKPEDNIKTACAIMSKHDLGGLVVVEKSKLVGVFTQGDLVQAIASGKDPEETEVSTVMGKALASIGPEADISEAAEVMVNRDVKRLPVIKNNKVVGILTQNDIVKISPSVYDILYEKAREEMSPLIESEIGLSGECEECGNYSDFLKNVNGTLMCEECVKETEDEL